MKDPITVYLVLKATAWQHLDLQPKTLKVFPEAKVRGDGRTDLDGVGVAFMPVYRDEEKARADYPNAQILEAQVSASALEGT